LGSSSSSPPSPAPSSPPSSRHPAVTSWVESLVVSKEEDSRLFLHRFILSFQFCKVGMYVLYNLILSYEREHVCYAKKYL
jgi:hypothetical protein